MFSRLVLLLAALTFASAAPVRVSDGPQADPAKKPCCFKNPAYAGTCKVPPAEGETCASILVYLNNPMAEGKSYCEGTTVRGGWTEVSCDAE